MRLKNIAHWIKDYLHAFHKQGESFFILKPPKHYLGQVMEDKKPIILIPGIFEKWNFLKDIANPLSLVGHPVYILDRIKYNTKEIDHNSKLIREFIEEKDLKQVIIIAHSKGGLIGKNLLAFYNNDNRIEKVIAIAAPFEGSDIGKLIPHKAVKELLRDSEIIKNLNKIKTVNHKIVSIFGVFDNHVWPESSCYLKGAKNVKIETHGHHRILSNKKVKEVILEELK